MYRDEIDPKLIQAHDLLAQGDAMVAEKAISLKKGQLGYLTLNVVLIYLRTLRKADVFMMTEKTLLRNYSSLLVGMFRMFPTEHVIVHS